MTRNADVIVVGGGVIGASAAYHLAKRSSKVILVEREDHASGASGACDTAVFLQSKKAGIHLRLALASAELFKDLGKELDHDIEHREKGGMILLETAEERKIMEEFVSRQRQTGLRSTSSIAKRHPGCNGAWRSIWSRPPTAPRTAT